LGAETDLRDQQAPMIPTKEMPDAAALELQRPPEGRSLGEGFHWYPICPLRLLGLTAKAHSLKKTSLWAILT
jgi:hypothetical protein